MNDYCYSNIIEDSHNVELLSSVKDYANKVKRQVYILNKPLTDFKYSYSFKNGIIFLEASKKICFINLESDSSAFEDYCEDVLEDIYSISDNYSYKQLVGRPRTWKDDIVTKIDRTEIEDFTVFIDSLSITDSKLRRKQEILLSLFIGSINDTEKIGDLDVPESLLDKVKRKIQLFDSQQTRFIYQELESDNKRITIQGMSGTGKTELLLHKCKDLYLSDPNNVIGFTCFNKVLSSELKHRIPDFFDRMNANKQINPKRLMVVRAWGSYGDEYSGIYRYICHYYGIPFLSYRDCHSFDYACKHAIQAIKKKKDIDNQYAYTYMFVDESQDFAPSFFDLCELVTEKNMFVAGDIFQSIFETRPLTSMKPNFLLSNCYRTDPKTFMFAHALGLGLFEERKLRWLQNNEWELCGYQVKNERINDKACISLTREPIRRFEDIDSDYDSLQIHQNDSYLDYIIHEILELKHEYPTLCPEDVAIIYIDDDDYIYKSAPTMQIAIQAKIGWNANLAYETKNKKVGEVFISNRNNMKGLEFPFVFCISKGISRQPQYRNVLYTVLTRSFLRSYLILPNKENNGLTDGILNGGEEIMKSHKMTVVVPSNEEQKKMEKWLLEAEQAKSLDERLDEIFSNRAINNLEHRKNIKESVVPLLSPDTNDEDLNMMVTLFSKNMK